MTLNLTQKEMPSIYEYQSNLEHKTEVYFSKKKLYLLHIRLEARYKTLRRILNSQLGLHMSGFPSIDSRDDVLYYLNKVLRVPASSLTNYKSKNKSLSLDKAMILTPLLRNPEYRDFVTDYIEYTETLTRMRQVNSYLTQKGKKTDDEDTLAVNFRYEMSNTGRFYTKEENIQGITIELAECMVAPPGYFLYWGDFAQIDLRVAYHTVMRDKTLDDIFYKHDDKYESIARMVDLANGVQFNPHKFKSTRPLYKTAILARSYGAGYKTMMDKVGDKEFVTGLNNFYNTNPSYSRFQKNIENAIDFGTTVEMKDYFGIKQSYVMSGVSDKGEVKRQCLNYPIQSTSNSIVMHWINKTLEKLFSLGYTKDQARVYVVRHDEPILLLSNDVLKDLWVFADHDNVQVDDWDTLTLTSNFGTTYRENHATIHKIFDKVSKEASLTPAKVGKAQSYNPVQITNRYHVVQGLEKVKMYLEEVDGKFEMNFPGKTILTKVAELPYESHEDVPTKVKSLIKNGLALTDAGPDTQYIIYNAFTDALIPNPARDRWVRFVNAQSPISAELQSAEWNGTYISKAVVLDGQEATTA